MANSAIDYPWDKEWVNGTGTVVAHPCVLHSIVLNGATTLGTVTVYDDIDAADAGQIVAVYNFLGVSVSYQGITFLYDIEMKIGVHMVFTTFAGNFTITYK